MSLVKQVFFLIISPDRFLVTFDLRCYSVAKGTLSDVTSYLQSPVLS